MPRRFTSGGADVPQLQILLYSLGGVRRVFGDGHGDLHIVVGGELGAPGDELLSRGLITADGLVQIVDKDVGDVEIACVQAAQEALEHIGGGNAVFPGIQGGPLEHVIAAKAQCFYEALDSSFVTYQEQVLKNIKALSDYLVDKGMIVISGGTDNHLILLDVYNSLGITGKEAEKILDSVHITVNKNTIPNETLSPMKASGIRIGSPAMTTRGLKEEDFITIGDIIYNVLNNYNNDRVLDREKKRALSLTNKYKIYN